MANKIHNKTSSSPVSCLETKNIPGPNERITSWMGLLFYLAENSDSETIAEFFRNNWQISVYISAIYLVLVYYGTKWMKDRQAYDLRLVLAIWSALLSLGSIWGSIVVLPEFFHVLTEKGFVATYCDDCYKENPPVTLWYTIFSLSKVLELFDTAFIVLRKQKLIPLHWIHHAMTLIYTFYIYGYKSGSARWMVSMNIFVHSIMYGYYSLKAFRFRIPRPVAMSITTIQVIQMFFGFYIHIDIVRRLSIGKPCDAAMSGVFPGLLMYLLYMYFFVKFFIDSYLGNRHNEKNQSYQKKPKVILMKIDQNENSDDKINNNNNHFESNHLKTQ